MKNSLANPNGWLVEENQELGVPTHVYPYTAGIVGGFIGGAAMIIPALVYGLISGYGPWYPINLVTASVLPHMQSLPPQEFTVFSPSYFAIGLLVHIAVASGLGLLFAMLLPILPGRPEFWALIVGPLLWLGAAYIALPAVNPVMSQFLDWPSFAAANIIYGVIMGFWVAHTPQVRANDAHKLVFFKPSFLR